MALIRKAHVYRLYPTSEQAEVLGAWVGAVRFSYNLALEQRRDWYKPNRNINYLSQAKDLTELRAEVDWLRAVPVQVLQQGLRDLEQAYKNWWSGRAQYPKPRKRGQNDAMRFPASDQCVFRRISRRIGQVKIPKMGWVRFRWDKKIPGNVKNITFSRKSDNWFVSVQYEFTSVDVKNSNLPAIGVDRGVTIFAALSDGTVFSPINQGKKLSRVLIKAQRRLARKKKGSNNRKKQVKRVARVHARIASARKDFCHKISTAIAKNHGVVVLEKLEVRNMVRSAKGTKEAPGKNVRQKAGLNRAILDQGWGMFRSMLSYKLAENGGRLVEVSPAYTSQTCAKCGNIDKANRVSQSKFVCTACDHTANADVNAAINILGRWGTSSLPAEGGRLAPIETGTVLNGASKTAHQEA